MKCIISKTNQKTTNKRLLNHNEHRDASTQHCTQSPDFDFTPLTLAHSLTHSSTLPPAGRKRRTSRWRRGTPRLREGHQGAPTVRSTAPATATAASRTAARKPPAAPTAEARSQKPTTKPLIFTRSAAAPTAQRGVPMPPAADER